MSFYYQWMLASSAPSDSLVPVWQAPTPVFPSLGSSWGESSSGRITNWLVLKNLTPQVRLEHTGGGSGLGLSSGAWAAAPFWTLGRLRLGLVWALLTLCTCFPQIDGSTLRTLCMQHGPLITFHLNLPHGNALVRYSSKEEVVKAQKSLHM